jgi:hypothetical protein
MMVRIINGLSVRSGARQVHPKGPGPVSSLLDTGSLTGGEYQYHKSMERKHLQPTW